MSRALRIVFMGTPEFAVPSLKILVENGFNVVGVITAPDKPAGRGRQIQKSAVKEYAEEAGLNILQPEKLKAPEFLDELRALNANLQVVVAFRMLPEVVWNMPELGTFNLHASLLPQYRGAAPINWAVINGEKETGCTTFFLKHEIDTGDVIMQQKEPIHPEDNVGSLYERLMHKGALLVLKTVQQIEAEDISTTPQVLTDDIISAPKIFKETCEIDWSKSVEEIHNFIRGLSPYPAAWFMLHDKQIKVYSSEISYRPVSPPFETDNKTYLYMPAGDGAISIKELQMQGKKKMTIEEFLRGNKL